MEIPPPTEYAVSRGKNLAYQSLGDGPETFVMSWDIGAHLELFWTDPGYVGAFTTIAERGRLVLFERRGMGLSDPLDYLPSLEEQAQDVEAVFEAAGIERATLVGLSTTCQPVVVFAAGNPERVGGLVLVHPFSEREGHDVRKFEEGWKQVMDGWGQGRYLGAVSAGLVSPANTRLMAMMERVSASPATVRWFTDLVRHTDLSEVLGLVQAPTIVLGVPDGLWPIEQVRETASLIPGAVFREFPPSRPDMPFAEFLRPMFSAMLELSGLSDSAVRSDRRLSTMLFTDIVGSTQLAARLGDQVWRDRLREHDATTQRVVSDSGGRIVDHTGDGVFCVFEQPAAAINCAENLHAQLDNLHLQIRAGIHCGECEFVGDDVRGLAVHIAARVGALAGPGEVLVSRTIRDLVTGSGLSFASHGEHELKGVPGTWEVFALTGTTSAPEPFADAGPQVRLSDRAVLLAARRSPRLLRALSRATARNTRGR